MTQPITTEPITLEFATRTHAIATLHSVAQSFADAPDEPMPTEAELYRFNLTYAQFIAFADNHAAPITMGTTAWWARIPLATEELHGIRITMIVYLRNEDRTDEHRRALQTHNRECVES